MRAFFEALYVIVIGLGLGGGLSMISIQDNHGFGALSLGSWTAWPLAGSATADPYTRAKVAANAEVPLGAAEGIAFHARNDNQNRPLRRECIYRLSGTTPPGRVWTLAAHAVSGEGLTNAIAQPASLVSRSLLRRDDGKMDIVVGPQSVSGNWLPLSGSGPFVLILRLYDTQITTSSSLLQPDMPVVQRVSCAS
ncbi:MAG: DUF1214 domain-containing protein [Pseudomonadota bacterium]